MIALGMIRIAVDALVSRLVLRLHGRGFWRGLAAIAGGDAAIAVAAPSFIYWVANMSAGSTTHKTYATLAAGAVVLVAALLIWEVAIWLGTRPERPTRQRVGAAAAALLLGAAIPVVAVGAVQTRLNAPAAVTYRDVTVHGLPPAFDGLRVCCVGDLHLFRWADGAAMRRRLAPIVAAKPDLILFVGDYATGDARYERSAAQIIAEKRAPLGVYAVLGNHDRWVGEEYAVRAMREAKVPLLINENVALERGRDRLYIAGVNDPYTDADDLDAALDGIPPGGCVILLSHTPDIVADAKRRRVALVLAGHTHGGQINVPLLGPPVVLSRYGSKYAHGLFHEGATAMLVTRGVGEIAPWIRLNCPREIAVLTLRKGAGKG
jgi:predicted MPP superfamily phosphohydrolase